jgi:hypothetical protein
MPSRVIVAVVVSSLVCVLPALDLAQAKPRKKGKRALLVKPNSPQQLYMYYMARAAVSLERGRGKEALSFLMKAKRHKQSPALLCEIGYVYHRMGLMDLKRQDHKTARVNLLLSRKFYNLCITKATGRLRSKGKLGLRDIKRTFKHMAMRPGAGGKVAHAPSPAGGAEATITTKNCDAAALAKGNAPAPIAHATTDGTHVQLALRHFNLGICSTDVKVRVMRKGSLIEFVTYRNDRGSCVSLCDLTLRAPLTLPPGVYEVQLRRGGHHWIMLEVPPQKLSIPAPAGKKRGSEKK